MNEIEGDPVLVFDGNETYTVTIWPMPLSDIAVHHGVRHPVDLERDEIQLATMSGRPVRNTPGPIAKLSLVDGYGNEHTYYYPHRVFFTKEQA